MDRPFAFLLDVYYEWILEKTSPKENSKDNIEYYPKYWSFDFGRQWTMRWYRDLIELTGITPEEELVSVKPARKIPASYHIYDDEFDSVRTALEAASALNKNTLKSNGYNSLVKAENSCLERLQSSYDTTEINNYRIAESECRLPKQLYYRDITATVAKWRTEALKCLASHSMETGDGNREAFDKCVEDYAQVLVDRGTNPEKLDLWGKNYVELFVPGAIKKVPVE